MNEPIRLELTDEQAGLFRGAIDFVIKQGGTPAARQLLALDDLIVAADDARKKDISQ